MRPSFVEFDIEKATRVYRRNLPHWRQARATYFVTFRLNDAIPDEARRRLEYEEAIWLKARGISPDQDRKSLYADISGKDKFIYRQHLNRLREDVHDSGHGECFLRRLEIIGQLRTQIFAGDDEYLHVGDFVIMPNHVHMLIVPVAKELEECLKRIKGSSATLCNRMLGRSGAFWQADTFDHIVRDLDQRAKYRRYIEENPEKAGIKIPTLAYYKADWM